MKVVSPYNYYETINRINEKTCTIEEYNKLKLSEKNNWPEYFGSVRNNTFQLCKIGNSGKGGQHLIILGQVMEMDDKVYITYKPMLNSNHIVILLIMCGLVCYSIINQEMKFVIPLIALVIGAVFEFRKMYDEYYEFGEFIKIYSGIHFKRYTAVM